MDKKEEQTVCSVDNIWLHRWISLLLEIPSRRLLTRSWTIMSSLFTWSPFFLAGYCRFRFIKSIYRATANFIYESYIAPQKPIIPLSLTNFSVDYRSIHNSAFALYTTDININLISAPYLNAIDWHKNNNQNIIKLAINTEINNHINPIPAYYTNGKNVNKQIVSIDIKGAYSIYTSDVDDHIDLTSAQNNPWSYFSAMALCLGIGKKIPLFPSKSKAEESDLETFYEEDFINSLLTLICSFFVMEKSEYILKINKMKKLTPKLSEEKKQLADLTLQGLTLLCHKSGKEWRVLLEENLLIGKDLSFLNSPRSHICLMLLALGRKKSWKISTSSKLYALNDLVVKNTIPEILIGLLISFPFIYLFYDLYCEGGSVRGLFFEQGDTITLVSYPFIAFSGLCLHFLEYYYRLFTNLSIEFTT